MQQFSVSIMDLRANTWLVRVFTARGTFRGIIEREGIHYSIVQVDSNHERMATEESDTSLQVFYRRVDAAIEFLRRVLPEEDDRCS